MMPHQTAAVPSNSRPATSASTNSGLVFSRESSYVGLHGGASVEGYFVPSNSSDDSGGKRATLHRAPSRQLGLDSADAEEGLSEGAVALEPTSSPLVKLTAKLAEEARREEDSKGKGKAREVSHNTSPRETTSGRESEDGTGYVPPSRHLDEVLTENRRMSR
jgi:hypothetical protein